MTCIISTPDVKEKFGDAIPGHLQVDKWLTQRVVPSGMDRINSLCRKNGVNKGNVILLVKYGKRHPSQFPQICQGDWFISLVFYTGMEDLPNWFKAVQCFAEQQPQKALILGMMKPFYVHWAQKIYDCLKKERYRKGKIMKLLPDTTTQTELAKKLSRGCSLAVYVGHGRSRGWTGYRGFRWKHVEMFDQKAPIGTMISLSCSSLKQDKKNSMPLGLHWIMEGRSCAFIGACDSVKIKPLISITTILLECLSQREITAVNELLLAVNKRILELNEPEVNLTWSMFRLIGSPFQPLQAN